MGCLLSSTTANAAETTVVPGQPEDEVFDTAFFKPEVVTFPPASVTDEDVALPDLELDSYLKCGDPGTPGVNPVWSMANGPTGWTIDQTDPYNPLLKRPAVANPAGGALTINCTKGVDPEDFTVRDDADVPLTISWIINTAGSGEVLVSGYFVDCNNGNDSLNGLTHATRWKTLGRVNNSVTASGVDVWLLAGTTCDLQTVTVDWGSLTSSTPVILGAYRLNGSGQPIMHEPSNFVNFTPPWRRPRHFTYSIPRPIISGTYKDSCRSYSETGAPRCAMNYGEPGTGTPGLTVPFGQYDGLVNTPTPNVIVQDLDLRDSAGFGTQSGGNEGPNEPAIGKIIIQRNRIDNIAETGIGMTHWRQAIIRYNYVSRSMVARQDLQPGMESRTRGESIGVTGCRPCEILIEANDYRDSNGGIGAYGAGYTLMRGNEGGNIFGVCTNWDLGYENVTEANRCFGGGNKDPKGATDYRRSDGPFWVNGYEHGTGGQTVGSWNVPGGKTLRRNNISRALDLPGESDCLSTYTVPATTLGAGTAIEMRNFGNTCLFDGSAIQAGIQAAGALAFGIQTTMNLFAVQTASTACTMTPSGNPKLMSFRNQWTIQPSDADCRGANDIYNANTGIPTIPNPNGMENEWPAELARPECSGAGTSAGVVITEVVAGNGASPLAAMAEWDDYVLPNRIWLSEGNTTGFPTPAADWVKGLTHDFNDNPRVNGGALGAIGDCGP